VKWQVGNLHNLADETSHLNGAALQPQYKRTFATASLIHISILSRCSDPLASTLERSSSMRQYLA
jgi:hypothetical protein